MKEKDLETSKFLGVEVEKEVVEEAPIEKEEKAEATEAKDNFLYIDNLDVVIKRVLELEQEKMLNPDVVHEEDAGNVFIHGEPHMVIDNQYVPYKEAQLVLQTRKVVREWLRLERLKKELKK